MPSMQLRLFYALVAIGYSGALTAPSGAAEPHVSSRAPEPAHEAMRQLALSIQRFTLDNGLRVVLNVDKSSPTIAVAVTYDVGSRNELPNRSGFAHLFEHLMFQGSRNVKKGEHFTLISGRGGSLNGTTSVDRTNYFDVLPLNELALSLWLEADRMRWLDVTQEKFENQRKVVQEEYRMRVADAPYRPALIRLQELLYGNYWPYAHPTIGSMDDLNAAKFEWVLEFYHQYYRPNNAVLTVAGNFDTEQAAALIQQYFGDIPRQPEIPRYAPPAPPTPHMTQQRETVRDRNAKTPALLYGWLIPETSSDEHYALEMATMLLTDGESSLLHQDLVSKHSWAREVSSWTYDRRGPDALTIMATLTDDAELSRVRKRLEGTLERLGNETVAPKQLQRVRNRLRSFVLFQLQSNSSRAVQLGEFEVFRGDARLLSRQLERYLAVDPEAIRSAVAKHLRAESATIVEILPAERSTPGESAQ